MLALGSFIRVSTCLGSIAEDGAGAGGAAAGGGVTLVGGVAAGAGAGMSGSANSGPAISKLAGSALTLRSADSAAGSCSGAPSGCSSGPAGWNVPDRREVKLKGRCRGGFMRVPIEPSGPHAARPDARRPSLRRLFNNPEV
jgi:hypothetical protein